MSEPLAVERLRAWADCVQRLIAAAPIAAVKRETGATGGSSTPPDRAAIREAARATVDRWFARDAALLAHTLDLDSPETERWVPPTPADLDALLIEWWPLQRDEYAAYVVERARAEVAAILFGGVDDETFDRVMSALGEPDRPKGGPG